jgi:hypothetical protein
VVIVVVMDAVTLAVVAVVVIDEEIAFVTGTPNGK